MTDWLGKPYYSLDAYLKKTFGEKVYKLSLDGGMTCPNRDGTCGCVSSEEAEDVLRAFYGLPQRGKAREEAPKVLDLADFL